MTAAEVLGAWCRYLRADVCGLSAVELGALAGVSSSALLRREQGELGGPSRAVLPTLLGIRAERGVQGALPWTLEELVDQARATAERLSTRQRAA